MYGNVDVKFRIEIRYWN